MRCPSCGYAMDPGEVKCARCRKLLPVGTITVPADRSWRTHGVLTPQSAAAEDPLGRLRAGSPQDGAGAPAGVQVPGAGHASTGPAGPPGARAGEGWVMGQVLGWLNLVSGVVMLVLCGAGGANALVWLVSAAVTVYGLYVVARKPTTVHYSSLTFLLPIGAVIYLYVKATGS